MASTALRIRLSTALASCDSDPRTTSGVGLRSAIMLTRDVPSSTNRSELLAQHDLITRLMSRFSLAILPWRPSVRRSLMVWTARSEATLMASTSARRSRTDSWFPWISQSCGEDDVRQRDQRSEGVVEIVRDTAREHAQGLHALRRGQSLLHAAFVQHARLHELLPQADALQRGRDLVAERRVGVDPVGIAEGDDAEELVLERQREDEEALPRVVCQRAGREQLAGGVLHVFALQQLAVPQAHRGSQQIPGPRPPRTPDTRCGRRRWADP